MPRSPAEDTSLSPNLLRQRVLQLEKLIADSGLPVPGSAQENLNLSGNSLGDPSHPPPPVDGITQWDPSTQGSPAVQPSHFSGRSPNNSTQYNQYPISSATSTYPQPVSRSNLPTATSPNLTHAVQAVQPNANEDRVTLHSSDLENLNHDVRSVSFPTGLWNRPAIHDANMVSPAANVSMTSPSSSRNAIGADTSNGGDVDGLGHGTLMINRAGHSRWLGRTSGSEWINTVCHKPLSPPLLSSHYFPLYTEACRLYTVSSYLPKHVK